MRAQVEPYSCDRDIQSETALAEIHLYACTSTEQNLKEGPLTVQCPVVKGVWGRLA